MNLTKLSIKRPVSVCIIVLALVVFGIASIMGSPIELIPDIEMPMMMVMTTYPGAGPEEVEDLVTQPLEDAVSTLNGLDKVTSQSQENVSMILLEMEYGTDMDVAHMDLQKKLSMYTDALPDTTSTPVIMEMSMDSMPSITLSAEATGDIKLLNVIKEDISPELEKLSGVATVNVMGGNEDYISVKLIDEKMKQYGLDMMSVISTIETSDFSIPAGDLDRADISMMVRGGVDYKTTEALKTLPIRLKSGDLIHLSDIADVSETTKEPTSISRYNGFDTITLSLTKRQSSSTVDVCRQVRDTVEILNASDLGVKMTVIDDASETIMDSVKTVADTLFMGIILSMIVLFVFFGNIKASLIVGTAMPVSLLVTLILMNLMGLSLNIISLGGLVIGVGMMVDNSIVVIESCFRRREASQQRSLKEAAIEGAELVTSSVIAGTITTVVVFLPIALLQGMSGQMFKQLGFTIIFSLTASLISALTLVPLLFVRLDPKEKTETWVNRTLVKVENSYGNILKKSFSHRKLVATFSVVLLIVSFALIPFINMELLPASDEGTVQIDVDTKPGLSLEESDKIATTLETMVSKHPDVDRYTVSAGDKCSVTAYLKGDRKMSTIEVVDQWRDETKNSVGYNVSISSSNMTSQMTGGGDVAINLQGNDLDILREASKTVEEVMRQNPGVIKVTSSLTSGNPQAEIKVDPMRANAVGLSPQQVVGLVYNMISGKEATTIRQDGQEYSVFVEYPQGKYETVSDLSGLMLSAGGYDIPLLDIATIEYSNSPQAIMKENSQYIVTVTAQPSTEAQYTAPQELKSAVDNTELPRGVTISEGRQQEQMMKEFTALGGAIAAAIFLVFMVMAMQFESPRFSALIMLCIPFSLIGSFGMLLLTRSTLSMPSMIGFLMLVGTVVNSGILFIDTANRYRETMDIETALIEAGRTRLRPILMTTLTTVLSMIPMGMGFGENGKLMQGMAVVIIGGLVASTILTLLLLPTFYIIVYPKGDDGKKKKKRKKLLGKSDKQDTEELTQAIEDFTVPNLSTDS